MDGALIIAVEAEIAASLDPFGILGHQEVLQAL